MSASTVRPSAHRNTVFYRIRRLQEDFAIPLEEPSQHADLLLGVSLILLDTKGRPFFCARRKMKHKTGAITRRSDRKG